MATLVFDKARKWLAKIGGTWTEAKRGELAYVVVSVKSAKGATVSARAQFTDSSRDRDRDPDFQRAFVWACVELKRALR